MKSEIKLRNLNSDAVAVFIISLILGLIILYWGLTTDMVLKISGARLDKATSRILLILIASGSLFKSILQIVVIISIRKYGALVISMDDTQITYPKKVFMKGYQKLAINKSALSKVEVNKTGQHQYQILLMSADNKVHGAVESHLLPHKEITVEQAAQQILNWIKA